MPASSARSNRARTTGNRHSFRRTGSACRSAVGYDGSAKGGEKKRDLLRSPSMSDLSDAPEGNLETHSQVGVALPWSAGVDEHEGTSESSSEEDDDRDEDFDPNGKRRKTAARLSQRRTGGSRNDKAALAKKGKTKAKTGPEGGTQSIVSSQTRRKAAKARNLILPECDDSQFPSDDSLRASQLRTQMLADQIALASPLLDFPSSASSLDAVPRKASKLKTCPFCYEEMPRRASKRLEMMMQYWLDALHDGEDLNGSTATLEVCFRHREESDIIPKGIEQGWIEALDPRRLEARVKGERKFLDRMRRRIDDPDGSDWFTTIKTLRNKHGRKADSALSQMNRMNDVHFGYYGELGWETLHNLLVDVFITNRQSAYDLETLAVQPEGRFQPLSAQDYIDKVLLPELICMLIQDDEEIRTGSKVSIAAAKKIRDRSHRYGAAMFPSLSSVSADLWQAGENSGSLFEEHLPPTTYKPAKGRASQATVKASTSRTKRMNLVRPSKKEALTPRSQKGATKKRSRVSQAIEELPSASPSRPRPRPSAHYDSDAAPSSSQLAPESEFPSSFSSRIVNWTVGDDEAFGVEAEPSSRNGTHYGRNRQTSHSTSSSFEHIQDESDLADGQDRISTDSLRRAYVSLGTRRV